MLNQEDLSRANLRNRSLRNADLRDANLREAKLVGTDLTGVKILGADVQGADLRDAKGLTATIVKSAKNWDSAFYGEELRKQLGLPDDHNKTLSYRLTELAKTRTHRSTQ
jgi:uncharacterized protein YjbI with pentapeptide repeats